MSLPSDGLSVDASGRILFQDKKGYEDKFRKHERSSGTSDIWMVSHLDENPVFSKLTDFNGHDINPQWIEDGLHSCQKKMALSTSTNGTSMEAPNAS